MKCTQFFKKKHALLILLLATFPLACAVNPVTGRRELSLLSYADEARLGKSADGQITGAYGLYRENPEIEAYISNLGERMASISHRPFLQFHFRVLDSPVVNAFALPGGYVYVTRGLLAYMNSEAELAGVQGHEIGHVTARHAASQYTKAQVGQIGFSVGSVFFPPSVLASNATQIGVGLLFLGFSRAYERQADSLGVEYSSRLGYDATYMARFFKTLGRMREQSGESLPGWLATHPDPVDRQAATMRMARRWQRELPPYDFLVGRDSYLDMIDGLVFGEEPRQGFSRDGHFYHPILDFQFPVPDGWQVMNTPERVRLTRRHATAAMELTLSEEPSAEKAAAKYLRESGASVLSSSRKQTNGYLTEIRESRLSGRAERRERFRVLSYFIEKAGRVFVFQSISPEARYDDYVADFRLTMDHFDRIRDAAVSGITPLRLKVVAVAKSGTLRDFLQDYPNDELNDGELAILNGRYLGDRLEPGTRIKVLVRRRKALTGISTGTR